jgi:CubicO group peptidase (beta-lactamase class C family)
MLAYSAAWDDSTILNTSSVARAWAAARNSAGAVLPYGLGWFVDEIDGQKIVWHYGLWTGISSLIIKIPARHITYVLLANSDQLSAEFKLGSGDLRSSPFARAFLSWAQLR